MTKTISKSPNIISHKIIEEKILFVRGQKVMLDKDLASLYEVETRILNKAVTRNLNRFPDDFCFRLSKKEFEDLMFHFGTSKRGGTRKSPRVFTEHGILMLSSVLNSKRAVQVNIQIMRTFTKLRELMATHKDLKQKIETIEKKYDYQFKVVFEAIKQLLEPPAKPKRHIEISFINFIKEILYVIKNIQFWNQRLGSLSRHDRSRCGQCPASHYHCWLAG